MRQGTAGSQGRKLCEVRAGQKQWGKAGQSKAGRAGLLLI